MNLSHLILDNSVSAFEPKYENIADFPGFRISSNCTVESSLCPTPGKRDLWTPGDKWRQISIMTAKQSAVLMVSLRSEGKVRSLALKKLLWEAFVGSVPPNHSIMCIDKDESNVNLTNLCVIPGKFIRRTTIYQDRKR